MYGPRAELTIDIGCQPAAGMLRAARPPGTWPVLINLPALQLLGERVELECRRYVQPYVYALAGLARALDPGAYRVLAAVMM